MLHRIADSNINLLEVAAVVQNIELEDGRLIWYRIILKSGVIIDPWPGPKDERLPVGTGIKYEAEHFLSRWVEVSVPKDYHAFPIRHEYVTQEEYAKELRKQLQQDPPVVQPMIKLEKALEFGKFCAITVSHHHKGAYTVSNNETRMSIELVYEYWNNLPKE